MTMMRGAHPLRNNLKSFLETTVPKMVTLAEAQWGTTITKPTRYEAYEPTGMRHGDGPLIAVGMSRGGSFSTVDLDGWGAKGYRPQYSMSIYTWCFTEEDENGEVPYDARVRTLALRDDLAAIVRATLLDNISLGHPDLYQFIEGSLVEAYSEGSAVPNASGRWVAGVVHTFDMKSDEKLDRTGINTIETTPIDFDSLP